MSKAIFQEMHQLSRNDELRYQLLMRGVRRRLEEQKQNRYNLIEQMRYRKKLREIQVKQWY
ncbi:MULTISPECIES: hypothetical protein [Paenibacillus]|uniref:Uncharacterized protein n=2 Tax=Paenibacillus TaxID=44249 RepID=A0AAP5LP15_PAEAM|nr:MULTISPECIES: hypothetical protein [Paenibacillus]KQY92960.1 hypothetical protein ASD24_21460 [Paenibacillus sp. Root52]MCM3175540.1 hypothetical protein [Paenibacillus sp. MER 99-2]MDR6725826.1 hypothetical protein [Paenibacillus amylolyticus]